eukprot:759279-Hanusia_phi.AAC.4
MMVELTMTNVRLSLLLFCFSVVCFQAGASSRLYGYGGVKGTKFTFAPVTFKERFSTISLRRMSSLIASMLFMSHHLCRSMRFSWPMRRSQGEQSCKVNFLFTLHQDDLANPPKRTEVVPMPLLSSATMVTKAVQDFAGKARDASEITVASLVEKSSDAYKALSHHVRNHPTESASIAFTGAALVGLRLKFYDSKASKPAAPAKVLSCRFSLIVGPDDDSWSKLSNAANSLALPPLLAESASLARRWVNGDGTQTSECLLTCSSQLLKMLSTTFLLISLTPSTWTSLRGSGPETHADIANARRVQGTAQGKMLYSG